MPRYLFQLGGHAPGPDTAAVDLAGPDQAREEAVRAAGEMLRDLSGKFWHGSEWSLEVADEQGQTVCKIRVEVSI